MNETIATQYLFEGIPILGIQDRRNEDFQFQEKNTCNALLLNNSSSSVLPADEHEMLGKMLNALKMSREDFILLSSSEASPFNLLKNRIIFEKLIAFGISPVNLGLNIKVENYQLINFSGVKIIFSESLSALLANEKSKGQFWKALKEMFGIN